VHAHERVLAYLATRPSRALLDKKDSDGVLVYKFHVPAQKSECMVHSGWLAEAGSKGTCRGIQGI